MKKVLFFGIAALAALSFSSCQKEVAVEENNNLVTVTLRAEKAGIDTRTEAVEEEKLVSFKWTEEDKDNLKLFVVGKDANNNDTFTEVDRVVNVSSDYKTLTVTATVEESSTLRAVVSGAWTNSNKPKVNENQSPKTNNFDPSADILVADDVTVDGLNEELLTFRRPITINKMTLKNMVAGERVNEITISSEQHLTGYYTGEGMDGQLKKITLSYDNAEVGSDGLFPVYFVAVPKQGHQLTVVVKTDQFTYTKTLGPVNFTVGKFSTFSTKLPAGTPVVDTDYTGDWVITGENDNVVYAAQAYVSGNNIRALAVSLNVDEEKIVSSEVDGIKMHFDKVAEGEYAGLYTIKDASNNYLYAAGAVGSSGGNYLKGTTTLGGADYYWSVEEEADGTYSIKASESTNRNVMQFNYNKGNPIFSCYGSDSQKPVTIYPYSWVVEDTVVEEPKGTGTLEDPFNPVAAVEMISEMEADVNSTEDYYISGIVSSISSTFSTQFGNATFFISEDGSVSSTQFQAYRVLYLGNRNWVSGDTQIKVGDEVIICGKVVNYGGTTPETVQKKAYIYSLNGDTGEETPVEYDITIADCVNGSVEPNVDTAAEGAEVTLTITPDTGYELDEISVVTDAGDPVTVDGKKFIMPAAEVIVTVTFKEKQGGEDAIQFSWTRSGSDDTVTDGYTFTPISAKSNANGYYQDKSSSEGLDVTITKTDGSAIFTSTPGSITLTAKVGGGSAKDPLENNVIAYLIDGEGNAIASTQTVVTTKVSNTNGTDFEVTIPNVAEAYGVKIVHEKESGYNVRLFGISVVIE